MRGWSRAVGVIGVVCPSLDVYNQTTKREEWIEELGRGDLFDKGEDVSVLEIRMSNV